MCSVLVQYGWFSLKSAQMVPGTYVKYRKCALQQKHDKSLTCAGSGLRGAYAEHTFFTFTTIHKKGVSATKIRLRPAQNDTKK